MFETLSESLRNIAQHSAFLLWALPLLGAGLVLASTRFGPAAARRSALTNVGLSCFTAVLTFLWLPSLLDGSRPNATSSQFDPSQPAFSSSILWARWTTPDGRTAAVVRLSVGATEATFLPSVLIPFLALVALLTLRSTGNERDISRHVEVLVFQSLLTGVLVAQDLILLSLSLLSLPLFLGCCTARSEHVHRRSVGRTFALVDFGGGLLVTISLCGIATSVPNLLKLLPEFPGAIPMPLEIPAWFRSIPHAVSTSTAAKIGWWSDAGAILSLLISGIVVLSPIPPFRKLFTAIDVVAPHSIRPLLRAWPLVSWSLVARLFAPLHFQEKPDRTLMLILILMAAFAAIAATRASDLRERRSARLSAHTAIAMFASLTMSPDVQAAGVWLACIAVLTAVLLDCVDLIADRHPGIVVTAPSHDSVSVVFHSIRNWLPWVSAFVMIPAMIAIVGGIMRGGETSLPGSPAAFGLLLLWTLAEWSILHGNPTARDNVIQPIHRETSIPAIIPSTDSEVGAATYGIIALICVAFVSLLAVTLVPQILLSRIRF